MNASVFNIDLFQINEQSETNMKNTTYLLRMVFSWRSNNFFNKTDSPGLRSPKIYNEKL